MKVTCKGPPGHGSKFIEGTAAEKMVSALFECLWQETTGQSRRVGMDPIQSNSIYSSFSVLTGHNFFFKEVEYFVWLSIEVHQPGLSQMKGTFKKYVTKSSS